MAYSTRIGYVRYKLRPAGARLYFAAVGLGRRSPQRRRVAGDGDDAGPGRAGRSVEAARLPACPPAVYVRRQRQGGQPGRAGQGRRAGRAGRAGAFSWPGPLSFFCGCFFSRSKEAWTLWALALSVRSSACLCHHTHTLNNACLLARCQPWRAAGVKGRKRALAGPGRAGPGFSKAGLD